MGYGFANYISSRMTWFRQQVYDYTCIHKNLTQQNNFAMRVFFLHIVLTSWLIVVAICEGSFINYAHASSIILFCCGLAQVKFAKIL